jgi:hypothetical protein
VAPIAGAALAKIPARVMLSVGLGVAGLGLALMSGLNGGSEWTALLAGFLVGGAGIGLINPVIATLAVSVVPNRISGMAAGVNDTFRQVGVAVGIAAYGALFLGQAESKISVATSKVPGLPGGTARHLAEAASTGTVKQAVLAAPPGSRHTLSIAARDGFISGFNEILLIGAGLCAVGAVAALFLIRSRDMVDAESVARDGERVAAEPQPALENA